MTDSQRPTPSPRGRQVGMAAILIVAGDLAIGYGRAHQLMVGPRLPSFVVAAALIAGGLLVRLLALRALRSTWHIERLVTTGIFARTRNPIYLSFALIVAGIAVLSRTWLAWPWVALCLVAFWLVAVREEADLRRAYGEETHT
jgi:protein-S-isoprenylcysteine O-methyltransferase Ste14